MDCDHVCPEHPDPLDSHCGRSWRRRWHWRGGRHHHHHGLGGIFWAVVLAIPAYFLWNHLAPTYLPTLPPLYQHLPFWDCAAAFALVGVLKALLF